MLISKASAISLVSLLSLPFHGAAFHCYIIYSTNTDLQEWTKAEQKWKYFRECWVIFFLQINAGVHICILSFAFILNPSPSHPLDMSINAVRGIVLIPDNCIREFRDLGVEDINRNLLVWLFLWKDWTDWWTKPKAWLLCGLYKLSNVHFIYLVIFN